MLAGQQNSTDIALVIDAMELLYTQKLDGFCIASSDADFALVMQLKANGHDVYGFGERKTPDPFVNACTTFLYLDSLDDPAAPAPPRRPPKSARTPRPPAPPRRRRTRLSPHRQRRPARSSPRMRPSSPSCAARWRRPPGTMAGPRCPRAGSAAQRQASIDPRNYGVRNFPDLFEAIGLFDIYKGENGHSFVADKRNKDKAARPSR